MTIRGKLNGDPHPPSLSIFQVHLAGPRHPRAEFPSLPRVRSRLIFLQYIPVVVHHCGKRREKPPLTTFVTTSLFYSTFHVMLSDHDPLTCETCTMAPPDPQRWTYTDYVCFLRSHGFHNLTCLDDYLRWGVEATHNPSVPRPQKSTTILLEFGSSSFRTSDLTDASKLRVLLKEWTRKTPSTPTTPTASKVQGRIIMVNNASPEMIDTLGGLLNIEPAFFASHIADHGIGSMGEVHTASPLASQNLRHQKQFFTIEYPCAFIAHGCGKDVDIEKLYCKGNYRRRVEVCSKYGKNKVALARRKISFYMKKSLDPWLCKFPLHLDAYHGAC